MSVFKNWRKILGFPSGYSEERQQKVRDAVNKQYSAPEPSYTPPSAYPETNQRIAAPSRDINKVIDYEDIIRRPAIQEAFPKGPLETQTHYLNRLRREVESRKTNLDLLNQKVTYNPTPTQSFFPKSSSFQLGQKVFTTLDIETDDFGRPISISASRLAWDKKNNRFETIDSLQRFYLAKNADLLGTYDVHGMTSAKLLSLRKQQEAKYGLHYNSKEQEAIRKYIEGSTVIGHNIVGFDLNKLFPDAPINVSTIDTVLAARSMWKGEDNSLDAVFFRIFGKTMEQAGLPHHDPNADTIASAMIAQAIARSTGYAGKALQYVMNSPESLHIAEYNEYMNSMITRGTYWDMFRENNLYEVFMSDKETGLVDANGRPIGRPSDLKNAGMSIHDGAPADMDTRTHLQQLEEELYAIASLVHSGGEGQMSSDLSQAYNQWNNYKRLSLVTQVSRARDAEEEDLIMEAAGYGTKAAGYDAIKEMARRRRAYEEKIRLEDEAAEINLGGWRNDIRNLQENSYEFDRDDALRRIRFLDKAERHGDITKEQRDSLEQLTGSYEDVVDATNEVIEANQRLEKTYRAIASIKPYDINQYVNAARNQWGGIMNASQGVIPSFMLNPIRRLGAAAFNDIDRRLTPWNAVQRVYKNVFSPLEGSIGEGGGAAPSNVLKAKAAVGVFNAGTQVYGNYRQARLEMKGYEIQNTLNTLGAMISWISTPFQLLHKALKLTIGSLGGFSYKLNNIMGNGINLMSQMGSPLTELTGVNYQAYSGTTMMDVAAMFGKGTMNKAYENYATHQQGMMYGDINFDRMRAAAMLGVFDEMYMGGANSQESYNNMANRLLARMQNLDARGKKDMMYLVGRADQNLGQLLHTANLLGVTDVNQFADPEQRGMFWHPLSETPYRDRRGQWRNEVQDFRWTQYEYGAAREQLGYSKMRFANRLWEGGGKQIYNSFNKLVDAAALGQWDVAIRRATEIWDTFRTKFSGVWDSIKASFSKDGDGEENSITKSIKAVGLVVENVFLKAAMKIVTVWDSIIGEILNKSQGLIAYLASIRLNVSGNHKTGYSLNISTIDDRMKYSDSDEIYEEGTAMSFIGQATSGDPREGMSRIATLGQLMGVRGRGGSAAGGAYNPNIGDVKQSLRSLRSTGLEYVPEEFLQALGLGGQQWALDDASIDSFIKYLKGTDNASAWDEAAVAFRTPTYKGKTIIDKQAAYDKTGVSSLYRQWTDATEGVLGGAIQSKIDDNYARVDIYIRDNTGKKSMIGADSKGAVFSNDLVMLQQMLPAVLQNTLTLSVNKTAGN